MVLEVRLAARGIVVLVCLALALLATSAGLAQTLEPLTLVTRTGSHVFQIEVARNDEDRARGLMHRRTLPADRGMLFDFERVAPVSMWMENTYISLDMIFIRPDGVVARVAQDTEPLSRRIVPSGEPVLAVLEVIAGTARRIGLQPGDRVEHPLFRKK
jgi:uncharacterized membrane protein (UPF0127 family)